VTSISLSNSPIEKVYLKFLTCSSSNLFKRNSSLPWNSDYLPLNSCFHRLVICYCLLPLHLPLWRKNLAGGIR